MRITILELQSVFLARSTLAERSETSLEEREKASCRPSCRHGPPEPWEHPQLLIDETNSSFKRLLFRPKFSVPNTSQMWCNQFETGSYFVFSITAGFCQSLNCCSQSAMAPTFSYFIGRHFKALNKEYGAIWCTLHRFILVSHVEVLLMLMNGSL